MRLEPFQEEFIAGATAPGVDTAALSLPRGNGKSWLAGHLVSRVLTPGDSLFRAGTESALCAASIDQSRIVYGFVRENLEATGDYKFLDSGNRISIRHKPTNTRLKVLSSTGKTSMGLVNTPLVVGDEPGSWERKGGQLLNDAIETAKGKPGSPLRSIYIGTLAPSEDGWWHDLVDGGSRGSTYVMALQGRRKQWADIDEIKRANPLTRISDRFLAKLIEERDEARLDARKKARFLSYRLNVPTAEESTVLLTVEEWELLTSREVPPRVGRPIVGLDLGGGRAWDAALAIWRSGRSEALAVAPGIPTLKMQEQRDGVAKGLYEVLEAGGQLFTVPGKRDPEPTHLIGSVMRRWGPPAVIICDRFRLSALTDAVRNRATILPRVARWSESTEDVDSLRRIVRDGPLSIAPSSRSLVLASLSAARIKSTDQGSVRLVKRGSNNTGRDDVAASLVLAAGLFHRSSRKLTRRKIRSMVAR